MGDIQQFLIVLKIQLEILQVKYYLCSTESHYQILMKMS